PIIENPAKGYAILPVSATLKRIISVTTENGENSGARRTTARERHLPFSPNEAYNFGISSCS
ncbi:MAG: hypothetical protein KC643_22810, partial [Nitrospira sp.]|nr:hypothetical protein [Nitrospira sp.]